jgi:hypothetical protein
MVGSTFTTKRVTRCDAVGRKRILARSNAGRRAYVIAWPFTAAGMVLLQPSAGVWLADSITPEHLPNKNNPGLRDAVDAKRMFRKPSFRYSCCRVAYWA